MNLKQRIRRDAKRLAGDPEAAALLACMAQHLFDPDLDTTFLARKCGAKREVRERLAAVVGPLKSYVTKLRMIEAEGLVKDGELPVAEIGERLGYRVERTFRRRFKDRYKVTPNAMRRQAWAERAPAPEAAAAGALEGLEGAGGGEAEGRRQEKRVTPRAAAARLRRQAGLGLLDAKRAGRARDRLHRRHPGLETAAGEPGTAREPVAGEVPPPLVLGGTEPKLEAIAASVVFRSILELPDTGDLRPALLDGVRMATSTAWDIFQQHCYDLSRWDRERAVEAADLGVQLLELHRPLLGEAAADVQALAWVFLARIQMWAGNFGAAEKALGFAWEAAAEGPSGSMAPWAEVEARRVEGLIRVRQGRSREAAPAFDRALELGRGLDRDDPNRIHSVTERLELASLAGDAETALPLCDELEELAGAGVEAAGGEAMWRALASYHRAKAEAATGRDDRARKHLLAAAELLDGCRGTGRPDAPEEHEIGVLASFVLHELARLDGRAGRLERYDSLLRRALDRYRRLRTPSLEAAAQAELAALCALRGLTGEARRRALAAADFFDRLPGHRRAWSAARRLYALANGGAAAPAAELTRLPAALAADLDPMRFEVTASQATAAARESAETRP